MSKSMDNYIAFNDNFKDMFGKIMSIPDDTMWSYYELLFNTSAKTLETLKQDHPMQAKKDFAMSFVD